MEFEPRAMTKRAAAAADNGRQQCNTCRRAHLCVHYGRGHKAAPRRAAAAATAAGVRARPGDK